MKTRARTFTVMIAAALLAATGAILPRSAQADTVTIPADFASGRSGTSAIFDGQDAYVFGGELTGGAFSKQIVAYDPVGNTVSLAAAELPTARRGTSAVFDGQHAYIFGGRDASGRLSQILKYDPSADTIETLSATLPSPRSGTSAVFDGQYAYVFGGTDGTNRLDQIVRFQPGSNSVTVLSATLPSARQGTSAIYDGDKAYVFGGETASGRTDEIVAFDPDSSTVSVMTAVLSTPRSGTAAAWVAPALTAFVYGGTDGTSSFATIVKFRPAGDEVSTAAVSLPSVRHDLSAINDDADGDGNNNYVFGGNLGLNQSTRIMKHEVTLGIPAQIVYTGASSGPWSTELPVSVLLTDSSNSDPLEGRTIRFTIGSTLRTAVTDVDGVAATTIPLPNAPASVVMGVAFPGDPNTRDTSTTVAVTVTKRPTGVVYNGPTSGTERASSLSASLTDQVTSSPLSGFPLHFGLGDVEGDANTNASGQAAITLRNVPRGSHNATAVFNGNALYATSAEASVPYDVDWGYVFEDEEGNGTFRLSFVTNVFEFDGPGDDDVPPTADALRFVSTGLETMVSPAPVSVLAILTYGDPNVGTIIGAFDLENEQFLAVVVKVNGSRYTLRRTCIGDEETCPELPQCIFNQPPVSDVVVVHDGPFCP